MSNDLQMQISAEASKALSGLNSVDTKVQQLTRSTQTHNRATQDFQRVTSHAFREASGHAESFLHTVQEQSHAMRLMGGVAGEAGHKIGILARVTQGGGAAIGVLGLAATVGAVALEAYNYAVEQTAERTKKATEITKAFTEAVTKGSEQRGANAAGAGLSQADTVRKLNGVGGFKALHQADDIARELGIPIHAAREGVLKSFMFKDEKERGTAIEASKQLHLSGMGDFGGFDALHKSHVARNLIRQGNAIGAAGEVGTHGITGRYATSVAAAENSVFDAMGRNADNPLLREGRYKQGVENETQLEQENRAARGVGRDAIEGEARKALDPIGSAISENTKAVLRLVAAIENPYDKQAAINSVQSQRQRAVNQRDAITSGDKE